MDQPKYFRCPDGDVIRFPNLVHCVDCDQDGLDWVVTLWDDSGGRTWIRKSREEAIQVRADLISILNLNVIN